MGSCGLQTTGYRKRRTKAEGKTAIMEPQKQQSELVRTEKLSLKSLAVLLDEMGQYHRTEVNESTVKVWYEDLSRYSEAAIRDAWKQHRVASGYFPFVSDLKKFLDFKPVYFQEAQSNEPPCGCTKEKLVALNGEYCEHGFTWGLAALKTILGDKVKTMPAEDFETRKAELRAQAERVSK